MLKVDLHAHTAHDPQDIVPYTTTDLIDRAAELGFDAIAVTLHDRQRGVMDRHPDLFDAVELNAFYTHHFDFNRKAIQWARRYGKPLVANSDVRRLPSLGAGFSFVDADPLMRTRETTRSATQRSCCDLPCAPYNRRQREEE